MRSGFNSSSVCARLLQFTYLSLLSVYLNTSKRETYSGLSVTNHGELCSAVIFSLREWHERRFQRL